MAKKKSTKKAKTARAEFRTPIVAVMGHVDHGKTTLLDSLRGASVVETEAGGITQNTRAHQIVTDSGNKITFIDTPGHEAFSQMRERGAEVTDIVLLIVAADDGLQPQTIESIKFAQETGTPIIVAINKVDLKVKTLDKVKSELANQDVSIEEYGGDVMAFEISALKKTGLKELVEGIELFAEVSELKSNKVQNENTTAEAYVLESQLDKKMGSVALCILKAGKLAGREAVVTSEHTFRTRALLDEFQKPVKEVHESDPFWITGLRKPLETGETIYFTENEKVAKELQRTIFRETETEAVTSEVSTSDLIAQMFQQQTEASEGVEQKSLPVVVKSATQGTLEAVLNELDKLNTEDVKLNILEASVGAVSERDIERVKIAKGIILAFQLPINKKITDIARRERVLLRNYEIIYEMLEEVEAAMEGLLEPAEYEVEVARATVKQIFTLTDKSIIAGCEVTSGTMTRGYDAWVERGEEEVGRGKIANLRILKDEVKEVKKGFECGILISPTVEEIAEGDEIVAFKREKQ